MGSREVLFCEVIEKAIFVTMEAWIFSITVQFGSVYLSVLFDSVLLVWFFLP